MSFYLRFGLFCVLLVAAFAFGAGAAELPVTNDLMSPAQIPTAIPSANNTAATTDDTNSVSVPVNSSQYKLAPDDVIRMTVWGEPELREVFLTVTPEGTIFAPLVGSIQAAGRTIEEVKKDITDKFVEMRILKNPLVQLSLQSMHRMRVRVLGQVQRPGLVYMREGDSVDQAIAEAGGFIPDMSDLARTSVKREGASEPIIINMRDYFFEGKLSENIKLQEGDTIYIPEDIENRYFVTGFVMQPRMYPLKANTTVTQAINLAGGAVQRGEVGRTTIIRKGKDGKPSQKIPVNVAKILSTGDTSLDVKLEPGDVVLVPETKTPDLQKIGAALNILSTWVYLNRLGLF